MNFPLVVARRYFFSKYKRGFINLIVIISVLGVALSTAALIVILSVFNGLEGLHRQLFSTIDADLKVSLRKGKRFEATPLLLSKLRAVPGVRVLTEVIEDNALIRYGNAQMVVMLRGVSDNFLERKGMATTLTDGKLQLRQDSVPLAIIGQGVAHTLSVSLADVYAPLQVWYPKNRKRININSENAFNRRNIRPGGVFALEQQYDDSYVFVPLAFAQELLEYGNQRTALELLLQPGADLATVEAVVRAAVGENFTVQNQEEQHASILRAIKIEKLFGYIALTFVMALASFNIFFSLTMLALDKQKDVAILFAMGARAALVRRIFLSEGTLIALAGAAIGLVLGLVTCWLQQQFGLIPLGMVTAVVSSYPIEMKLTDFLLTGAAVVTTTLLASLVPALRAAAQTGFKR